MIHRDLQGRLNRLGPAIAEMRSSRPVDRADLFEFLAQFGHVAIVKISPAEMDEFVHLLCDGRDDLGVAMAGRAYRHSGVAVEKDVTVRVFDPNAFATFD